MDRRLYIAAHALQGLLAHRFEGNENNGFSCLGYEVAASEAVAYADSLLAKLAKVSPPVPAEPPAPPADASGAGSEMVCCWGSCDLVGDVDLATGAPFCRAHLCCELGARLVWARRVTPPKEAARRAGELAEKFGGGS